jgi:hypothetical protein
MRFTLMSLTAFALLLTCPVPTGIGIHGGLVRASWPEMGMQTGDKPSQVDLHRTIYDNWTKSKLAVSNDGKRIYFPSTEAGVLKLYELTVDKAQLRQIEGTEGGFYPFLSPDNKWLGFFAARKLKKVPLAGGPVEILGDAPNPFGAAWGPNGKIIFTTTAGSGFWQVSESGGEPQRLSIPSVETRESAHRNPVFLPGGKYLLFSIWYGAGRHTIALMDLATGKYKPLVEGSPYAQYATSGHIVFTRPDGLYAIGFNLDRQAVSGREVRLLTDVQIAPKGNRGFFEISQSGSLVYVPRYGEAYELVLVSQDGSATPLPVPRQYYSFPRFSPDGSQIAVNVYEQGSIRTWIVDRAAGRITKLAAAANSQWPIWNPNGKQVYVSADESGPGQWSGCVQGRGIRELRTKGLVAGWPLYDRRRSAQGESGPEPRQLSLVFLTDRLAEVENRAAAGATNQHPQQHVLSGWPLGRLCQGQGR